MQRTVPQTASEEIELYLRTAYSLLRTSAEVQIRSLEETHAGMNSLLHPYARKTSPDISAFIYSLLRLPDCMPDVQLVILGQSLDIFIQYGCAEVEGWQPVSARARRRRCFFDRKETLACFIASRSDIDDVIPALTAFQIEWNKLHFLLQGCDIGCIEAAGSGDPAALVDLTDKLQISPEDTDRLRQIWGGSFAAYLLRVAKQTCRLKVRLLGGSFNAYRQVTRMWWDNLESHCPEIARRPVYFISSNPHSIVNPLTGFALANESALARFVEDSGDDLVKEEWQKLAADPSSPGRENFLYYLLKKAQQAPGGETLLKSQQEDESNLGITRIQSEHTFDLEAQVIDLSRLKPARFDPRLKIGDLSFLAKSDALLLNIDYPLGLSAYNILAKVAEHVSPFLGVYVMGKSATLNGVLGDVIIPNVVQDEHSQNTYMFQNVFSAADVAPNLIYGTVLDNQKSVTVLGTFLQNAQIKDIFYREEYTDIEMEGGPYLSAVYEMYRPKRHPFNEIVNLYGAPFDVGMLHYASDTPLSKGKNLGAGALSYFGMDSTYACSIAILRRIFHNERRRLAN